MGYFDTLHLTLERNTKASKEQGDTFGTAASSSAIHGITTYSLDGTTTGTGRGGPDMTTIEKFYGHFDFLASAATDRNIVIERLTATTTTQYNEITKLLSKISANSANTTRAAGKTGTRKPHPQTTTTSTCALAPPLEEKEKLNFHTTQVKVSVQGKRITYSF